ncbi:MAG TPA: TetR/AcrR family transcriptional regulator, partial [Rhodobacteraceae bacterium]|nr:TetR/AcrR family transcriptional regulator [Paracoccaceae bacterium]
ETAERLFHEIGYTSCSVERIIREIGVAKGTFYHYFKSKEEILRAIVDHRLGQVVAATEQVADDPALDALTKMRLLLSEGSVGDEDNSDVADMLHRPENRELHEANNVQSVLRLSPAFARIVEQGNREGVFAADNPLETIQVLLTGAQFLLDGGLFDFSAQEMGARRVVVQVIVEKALGAAPGSFQFMNPSKKEE